MATSALLILALFTGCLGHQATDDYDTDYNSDAELSGDYSDYRISKSEDEEYDYSGDESEEEEEEEWWAGEVHLPNFTSVESEHSITKGGTVRITCSVDSLQKGLLIWAKESQMLYLGNISHHNQGEKYRLEPLGASGSVLSVRQLDTEDAGVYTCQESAGQKKQNHTIYIQEPATIHIQFNKVREKENLHMACNISGGSPSTMIWWSKDGMVLTEKKKKARKLVYETEATREESGNYTCHMNNLTKTIEIKIIYGPDVEIGQVHLEDDMGYRETWVRCAVRSEPPSRVTWARDGQAWEMASPDAPMYAEDVDGWNHTLQIPSNPNSAGVVTGVFSCRATNGLNTVTQSTTVRGWWQCGQSQQLVRLSTKGLLLVRGRRPVVQAWLCKQGNKEEDRFEYKYGDDVFVPEHPPYKETLLFHEPGDIQRSLTSYNRKGSFPSVSKTSTLEPTQKTSIEPLPTQLPTPLPTSAQTNPSTTSPPSLGPTASTRANKTELPKSQQPPEVSTAVSPRTQRTTEDEKTYKVQHKKAQDVGQGVEREQGENLVIGWLCGGIVGLALLVFLVTILKRMWKRRRARRQQWRRPPLQWQVSALGARMARETVI